MRTAAPAPTSFGMSASIAGIDPVESYPMFSYEALIRTMEARMVDSHDWEARIGQRNWLAAEPEWMPENSPHKACGAICDFMVLRVHHKSNEVDVMVVLDPLVPGGTLMRLDADELALYCEES